MIGAADDAAGQHRQERQRIVAVPFLEIRSKAVGPVLRPHLVTVGHDMLQGLALFGRHPPQQVADVGVEVHLQRLAAHLVHFRPGRLRRRGRVLCAGGCHGRAQHDPLPLRHVPPQRSVRRHHLAEVAHGLRLDRQGCRLWLCLLRPRVEIKRRYRLLEHLCQGFLRHTVHAGRRREAHVAQRHTPTRN